MPLVPNEAGLGGGGARGYDFSACNASNMEQIRAAMRLLYADSAAGSGQCSWGQSAESLASPSRIEVRAAAERDRRTR